MAKHKVFHHYLPNKDMLFVIKPFSKSLPPNYLFGATYLKNDLKHEFGTGYFEQRHVGEPLTELELKNLKK